MASPATTSVTVKHEGGLAFVGQGPSGHAMRMDAAAEVGGADSAARPMEMLLAALGGCSGIDVALGLAGRVVEHRDPHVRALGRLGQPQPLGRAGVDRGLPLDDLADPDGDDDLPAEGGSFFNFFEVAGDPFGVRLNSILG